MPPQPGELPAAGVVTVVAGRHDHLRAQRAFLAVSRPRPLVHVLVALGDPAVARVAAEQPGLPTVIVTMERTRAGLPLAAARNAGARAALAAGSQVLIFLDVDCLPGAALVADYTRAAGQHPGAVVSGPVTYLPPAPAGGWSTAELARQRHPHPARPDPPPGTVRPSGPSQFWSLSFAVTAAAWRAVPSFYEGYVGYGAEDTDFAVSAAAAGAPLLFIGGADAFHQHHPVTSPPAEHLDDILRNAAVFAGRHGWLPMGGWLGAFARDGLTGQAAGLPRRTSPVRLATIPARHPYLDAVLPVTLARVDPGRVAGWEPDPLLDPAALAARAREIDVVHLHFGYDHLAPAELAAWLAQIRRSRLPLVVTVHDLRNPHHASRVRHDQHLRMLAGAADRMLTLTPAAAAECERRFGRAPEVLAHPTLLTGPPPAPAPAAAAAVLVPVKALRRNVRQPAELVAAVAAGARQAGAATRVLAETSASTRPEMDALRQLAAAGEIELDICPYLPEQQLHQRVAQARACVLPYQFGTHSGWVELCRDLGTRVVVPDCGHYADQWPEAIRYRNSEPAGLDAGSLRSAVTAACRRPPPAAAPAAVRLAERDRIRAEHDALYRELAPR